MKSLWGLWQNGRNVPKKRFASYGGYDYELETGLYHIGYRYYDPEIGRFLSIDPIGFGINWYVYALNDPISLFELFGLEPEAFHGVITGVKPIDWLLRPLGEAAWNYGYAAGEYDSGKASGWQVAWEAAKFSEQLFSFATNFGVRATGLSIRAAISDTRTATIYEVYKKKATNIVYVGRTIRDIEERAREHKRSGILKPGRSIREVVKNVPVKLMAAVEDIVHKIRKPPLNKRNPLSPRRKDYHELIKKALKWLRKMDMRI
ncbi:MAG: RHS repeat-associated core domain-containing protein [Armatimonadetes bacterium]|nr:RHS repeat-associated core domain-containing protein [Armatimonadota bacterium]